MFVSRHALFGVFLQFERARALARALFCGAVNPGWIRWFVLVGVSLFRHVFQVVGSCLIHVIVEPIGV